MIWVIIAVVVLYAVFHHHHYRRHRRSGLTIGESLRGPFGTRISIRKRF